MKENMISTEEDHNQDQRTRACNYIARLSIRSVRIIQLELNTMYSSLMMTVKTCGHLQLKILIATSLYDENNNPA